MEADPVRVARDAGPRWRSSKIANGLGKDADLRGYLFGRFCHHAPRLLGATAPFVFCTCWRMRGQSLRLRGRGV